MIESIASFLRGVLIVTFVSLNHVAVPAQSAPEPEEQPELANSQQLQPSLQPLASASPVPISTPKFQPSSTPSPTPNTQDRSNDQYVMEDHPSGQEGFYVLKNTPSEPMGNADEINQAVNDYRAAHGLNRLSVDEQICQVAQQRASEAKENFSHDGFQAHIEAGDYNHTGFSRIGENLWQGSFSGVHIVEFGWDRSDGHRANLQGDWTRGCAGVNDTTVAFIFVK